jgi:hypothetical protein
MLNVWQVCSRVLSREASAHLSSYLRTIPARRSGRAGGGNKGGDQPRAVNLHPASSPEPVVNLLGKSEEDLPTARVREVWHRRHPAATLVRSLFRHARFFRRTISQADSPMTMLASVRPLVAAFALTVNPAGIAAGP